MQKLADFRFRRKIKLVAKSLIAVILTVLFAPRAMTHFRFGRAMAETAGDSCVVATQDSYDKILAQFGDRYSASSEPSKTQVIIKKPSPTSPGSFPVADAADIICLPDTNFKRRLASGNIDQQSSISVAQAQSLTELVYRSWNRIDSLIGAEYVSGVSFFSVSGGYLSDLAPLSNLTNLTRLSLGGDQISDLTSLVGLINLTELSLSGDQISDLTPLSSLINLSTLTLNGDQISDLTPLSGITNLDSLILSGNQISDLAPLSSLTNLGKLNLWGGQISDLTSLADLINLTELRISGNQISDLTPLASLTSLASLNLSGNQISELAPLSSLTNLIQLGVNYSQVSDLVSLSNLINLSSLTLSGNQISDLTPLSSITNLASLNLSDNQISDLTSLASLTSLNYLELSGNQISDLTSLASLTSLNYLELSGNQISDIAPLANLNQLTFLDLSFNRIEDFSVLSSLTGLGKWDLNDGSQLVVKHTSEGSSWPNGLKNLSSNWYELEFDSLTNLAYDATSQTFSVIDPTIIAYVFYNCEPGMSAMNLDSQAQAANAWYQCSTLMFVPSDDSFGVINKNINNAKHLDVQRGETFTYETTAMVPHWFGDRDFWRMRQLEVAWPYHPYESHSEIGSMSVRLVEEIDPRITPITSELLVDGTPFNETEFGQYYRAITTISGQTIEALIIPRFLLPSDDPDWIEQSELVNLLWQNNDQGLVLDSLAEPLLLSLRTRAKLSPGIRDVEVDVPSSSRLYFGRLGDFDSTAPGEISFRNLIFYEAGSSMVTASFLNGVRAPRAGEGGVHLFSVVILAVALIGFGFGSLVFVKRARRRY